MFVKCVCFDEIVSFNIIQYDTMSCNSGILRVQQITESNRIKYSN